MVPAFFIMAQHDAREPGRSPFFGNQQLLLASFMAERSRIRRLSRGAAKLLSNERAKPRPRGRVIDKSFDGAWKIRGFRDSAWSKPHKF